MKAFLKNYRQSPRKVRLVADLLKGKSVERAVADLDFLPKRAAAPMKKLILSAVANAASLGRQRENLFIKDLRVDKGMVLKRMMPRAMGRGVMINKRSSHVLVLLGEKTSVRSGKNSGRPEKEKSIKKVLEKKKMEKKHE